MDSEPEKFRPNCEVRQQQLTAVQASEFGDEATATMRASGAPPLAGGPTADTAELRRSTCELASIAATLATGVIVVRYQGCVISAAEAAQIYDEVLAELIRRERRSAAGAE